MFRTAENITFAEAIAKALIEDYVVQTITNDAPFVLTDVHLYTNIFSPTPQMVIGDFTEATFGGYATVVAVVWLGPVNLTPTKYGMQVTVNFLATDPIGASENVTGYFLTDSVGTEIRAAEEFDTVVPFAEGGDFLSLDLILPLEALAVPTS